MALPTNLQEAILYFADPENCNQFLADLRWSDGRPRCPHCGSDNVTYLASVNRYKCYSKHPRAQFSLKVGTIFEDSPIGLDKWLCALWLIVNCKNGISSCEMARDLGITQKSAWFLDHRIRFALHSGSFETMLSGEVDADETFIGAKARNMHIAKRDRRITGTGGKDKTPVMGILERGGKVRTSVLPNRRVSSRIRLLIMPSSRLMVACIPMALRIYWSLLKRTIGGTYVSVEPFHLFRYLDEQTYRHNNRKKESEKPMTDFERFKLACSQIVGKRITWNQLTGKDTDAQTAAVN